MSSPFSFSVPGTPVIDDDIWGAIGSGTPTHEDSFSWPDTPRRVTSHVPSPNTYDPATLPLHVISPSGPSVLWSAAAQSFSPHPVPMSQGAITSSGTPMPEDSSLWPDGPRSSGPSSSLAAGSHSPPFVPVSPLLLNDVLPMSPCPEDTNMGDDMDVDAQLVPEMRSSDPKPERINMSRAPTVCGGESAPSAHSNAPATRATAADGASTGSAAAGPPSNSRDRVRTSRAITYCPDLF